MKLGRQTCSICNNYQLVPPFGPVGKILLVGEFPGYEEIQQGIPWVGSASDVLRHELAKVGINMDNCRRTNLWQHAVPKDKKERLMEFDWHFNQLMEEIRQAKYVLMMGSELAPLFFKAKVSSISGTEQTSALVPKGIRMVAAVNPAICLIKGGVVGDFRFAVQKFAQIVKGRM